jgi:hypothetical protein
MGRRLKVQNDCPDNKWCDLETQGTTFSTNKILVAIAQAFGVEIDSFGTQPDSSNTTGALSDLV